MCIRIYEVIGHMADRSIIHLNDMNMIEAFVSAATTTDLESETWLSSTLLGHLLSSTKELKIDLRLPLEAFKVLDHTGSQIRPTSTELGA